MNAGSGRVSETLEVSSLVDALYTAVRNQILTGQTAGGTRFTELDVAARYSVARPTAKAAIERLVHEGLLSRGHNKSARVPVLDADDVQDLYYCRGFLESEVMAALARERRVPETAKAALQDLRDLHDSTSVPDIVAADTAFHRALVGELRSSRLNRLYNSLAGEIHLCMAQIQANQLLHPSRIADEHAEILDAISKGDEEFAVRSLTAHLDRARVRLLGYLVDGEAPEDEEPA